MCLLCSALSFFSKIMIVSVKDTPLLTTPPLCLALSCSLAHSLSVVRLQVQISFLRGCTSYPGSRRPGGPCQQVSSAAMSAHATTHTQLLDQQVEELSPGAGRVLIERFSPFEGREIQNGLPLLSAYRCAPLRIFHEPRPFGRPFILAPCDNTTVPSSAGISRCILELTQVHMAQKEVAVGEPELKLMQALW